jgi:hypothetical protein
VSFLDDLMDQMADVDRWSRDMVRELSHLPDTLAQFREGVGNFQRVTKRLADATDTLEVVNSLPTGALRAVRDQLTGGPGGSAVSGAIGDLSEVLAAAVRLNPLRPRNQGSRSSEPIDASEASTPPQSSSTAESSSPPVPETDE